MSWWQNKLMTPAAQFYKNKCILCSFVTNHRAGWDTWKQIEEEKLKADKNTEGNEFSLYKNALFVTLSAKMYPWNSSFNGSVVCITKKLLFSLQEIIQLKATLLFLNSRKKMKGAAFVFVVLVLALLYQGVFFFFF